MNKFACRYSIIRFLPYSETGEFANAGVLLVCPETGYFAYRIQKRKHKRITDFFGELDRNVYLRAIRSIDLEMARVSNLIARQSGPGKADALRQVFAALVHPREAIVRFSEARVTLAANPEEEIGRLFAHYVERDFATREYIEQRIERRVRAVLQGLDLKEPFRAETVGDDEFYARFPLVQKRGERLRKIIKPFNLAQPEPVAIYEHGDLWMNKLKRLQERGMLPPHVLFAVAAPPKDDSKRVKAFEEIHRGIVQLGVEVRLEDDTEAIAEFAVD